jgi:hypothetical protein
MSTRKWLGIDFSGNHKMWSPGCGRSNVWIAEVEDRDGLELRGLWQVQNLPGDEHPFVRLCDLLKKRPFTGAGIDAPFSIPAPLVTDSDYLKLLKAVGKIPHDGRPFPCGTDFIKSLTGQTRLDPPKPYRSTDKIWAEKKVNIRSTLWGGARKGTAMTSACLTLLHEVGMPIWPWAGPTERGLIVEAFPAGQLNIWRLPNQKYTGKDDPSKQVRMHIITGLKNRINIPIEFIDKMKNSADAIDAVICAFAAIAVSDNKIEIKPEYPASSLEGWISVHV